MGCMMTAPEQGQGSGGGTQRTGGSREAQGGLEKDTETLTLALTLTPEWYSIRE